jgi:hypothetical protein
MAQTGLQSPSEEGERCSAIQMEGDPPSLRKQPLPLSEQLEALGFDQTLSETQDRWPESQGYWIPPQEVQLGWQPDGERPASVEREWPY